jgi:cytochrome c-type biogenesis protein CcmH/NrfG
VIERAAVAIVALICAAWMTVAYTAAHAEDQLRDAVIAKPDVPRAERLADTADRLTPGVRRLILLGQIKLRAGDARGAVALGNQAVAQEPGNAEAWFLLARAARTADPALARRAVARVRALVPPVPAP